MAKQNNPQMSARRDTITQITDINGEVILEIGLHEYTVRHADGSMTHRRINENIQLVDGTMWNPGLVQMAKIYVGVCQLCRTALWGRRSHGLVAMHRAELCVDCGVLVCPIHVRMGRDMKYRCVRHHRTHLLRTLLRPVFFERTDKRRKNPRR